MKRDIRSKIAMRHALPVTAALACGPAWAHPEIAGHVAAQPPVHGMIHAVMNAPALLAAAGLALGAAWVLVRLHRRTAAAPHCEPQAGRE